MSTPVLATKFYIPPPRPDLVARPRLIARLNGGLHRKLTFISAAAGFGKTTLVAEWIALTQRPAAWLSLDEGDSDIARFLTHLIAALQTLDPRQSPSRREGIAPKLGAGALALLQSSQQPPSEAILTDLLNEINTASDPFILVLDDYHAIESMDHCNASALIAGIVWHA